MENQENQKTETFLEHIAEIEKAIKPLNYEIYGFDKPYGEPLIIKLVQANG